MSLFLLDVKGILNTNSSCYMDTVLMSMYGYRKSPFFDFLDDNWNFNNKNHKDEINDKIISKEDIQVRNEIKRILKISIQKVINNENIQCSELRKIIEKFFMWKGISSNNMMSGQQDTNEFYDRIVKIFNFNPIEIINVRQSKVSEKSKIIKEKPVTEKMAYISIPNDGTSFDGIDKILTPDWEDLGENKSNWKHNSKNKPHYRFTRNRIQSIIPNNCLVFHVNRISYRQSRQGINVYKTQNKISMPTFLKFGKHKYFLFSCIVHIGNINGGHYISFFFDGNHYYVYDDLNPQIIRSTKIEKSKIDEFREKNGVMYFYYLSV